LLLFPGCCAFEQIHTKHDKNQKPWLQENFPLFDSPACQQQQQQQKQPPATNILQQQHDTSTVAIHPLCDPDHVLSSLAYQNLLDELRTKRYTKRKDKCLIPPPPPPPPPRKMEQQKEPAANLPGDSSTKVVMKEDEQGLEIQMGVALVQKMDLVPFGDIGDVEERAAEVFARYVHDQWGVGMETDSCGGAGILLFLSIQDRAVYISRGSALEAYLTDIRLDAIIANMREYLRAEQYDQAIIHALHDIMAYIDQGPPTAFETGIHIFATVLFPILWVAAIVGTGLRSMYTNSRMHRDYVRVQSQLSEIDRARAEALQGLYRATSCPICLEEWHIADDERVAKMGSDGQPIKLLRCGHCMDESCWAEWINSGRGSITKCPICQQDVGAGNVSATPDSGNGTAQMNQTNQDDQANDVLRENENNDNEDRIIRQYRRERNFRLQRLGYRYPQIIRPAQVQRWMQPTYDGALVRDPSFVQSNPAVLRPESRNGSSRMSSGGFGGGSSGGGRGGRW